LKSFESQAELEVCYYSVIGFELW